MKEDFIKVYFFLRKHGYWVVFGKVVVTLLGLLLSVVLTRLMSVQEYGSYQYHLSVFFLFGSFSIPGATNSVIKYVALGYDWTYQNLLKLRIQYSLLASIIFIVFGLYNIYIHHIFEAIIYVAFAVIFPLYHAYDLFAYFLHAKIELKRLNTLRVVHTSVQVLITITVYMVSRSVALTLITFIASVAVLNTVFYYKILPKSTKKKYDATINHQAKNMAIGLSLVGILGTIVGQMDKVLVFNLINPESLAVFSIGMMIGITINSLFKSILASFEAKLVVHNFKKWHYVVIFIIGSVIGVILSMIIPFVIEMVYGDLYKDSVYYASVVLNSLGIYLVANMSYDSTMLHHKKNIKSIYISTIGVSSVQLVTIAVLFLSLSSGNDILIYLPFIYTLQVLLKTLFIYILNSHHKCNIKNA